MPTPKVIKRQEQHHHMLSKGMGFVGNPVILVNMVVLVMAARASAELESGLVDL
jgi:hypothetical protein